MDTGDLDVSVEVDDTHVRILAGGRSLGRWCLADVVADRIVADEFELDLDGEVVRFLAEDQINFAYGAVQAMAEGWARYQAMNFVKRSRAVASARKANEPSRLRDAHHAFVMAREALGEEEANAAEEIDEKPVPFEAIETEEEPAQERPSRFRRRHLAQQEAEEQTADEVDRGEDTTSQAEDQLGVSTPEPEPAQTTPVQETEVKSPPAPDTADAVPADAQLSLSERLAQARAEAETAPRPVDPAVLPRKVPRIDTFPGRGAAQGDRRSKTGASHQPPTSGEERPSDGAPSHPGGREGPTRRRPAESQAPGRFEEAEEVEVQPEVEVETAPQPEPPAAPVDHSEQDSAQTHDPELVESEPSPPEVDNGRDRADPVQPGAYADGHHPAETSGLRASLRSVFSRSRSEPHEHSFVESTTAVGLTRRVCIECGHVSIGVSD
ncbi:MAG: hypothetical protein WB239_11865 [Acidimicrobiia bacterium]